MWEKIKQSDGVDDGPRWANKLLWRMVKVNRVLFYWREWALVRNVEIMLTVGACAETVLALITSFL